MDDPFDLADAGAPAAGPRDLPYLASLNPPQRQAVETLDGAVLVLAGAGTGKTRVLTTRLAHLLNTNKARPWEILAVTFTNKAAREMSDRVGQLIGSRVEGIWLGTFHSVGARILRRHAELVGLRSDFTILDDADQERLLKQVIEAENIDPKRWPPRQMAHLIDGWKNRGLMPDKVPEGEGGFADGKGQKLYRLYQERLATLNATDFGDLLLLCIRLFQTAPDVLADYHRRFRYILVDEYQDTNVAQYLWLRLLAQGSKNICCVGDDDQSIYGWRGAEVGNILRFETDFPGAKVIRLEQNYRSTAPILHAASGVIANNEGRLGKTLWTDVPGGEKLVVSGVWDGNEEARQVGDEIEALHAKGERLSEMAVLVRATFQMRSFEDRFIEIGLPYQVIGGVRFYQRQEIKDATSYLQVVAQPDNDIAFERIINTPKRGLGDSTVQLLHRVARGARQSLYRATEALLETDELKPKVRTTLRRLIDDFERWRKLRDDLPPAELAEIVLDESGYTEMWQRDRSPQAPSKLENLKEMVLAMQDHETLAGYLEHVALVQANDESGDTEKVSIMTLHGAKGLEFDTVFLPGWEEEVFPNRRALEETGNSGLEEERRLAYVGITRARRRCFISHAANRRVFNEWRSGIPSRFIEELPEDAVDVRTETGMYGATAQGGGRGMHQQGPGTFVYDAPWLAATQRLKDKGYRAGGYRPTKTIEGEAREVRSIPEGPKYKAGERVFHQKFGYGAVRSVDNNHLVIDFEQAGEKKVVSAFVKPA
ncbi:MAG: UvrD-helicase domain-containing protein [Pseudomonadota bacterium]|nr:UvrD-helicase domain-containing protein [Pseudomonadota bacterium]